MSNKLEQLAAHKKVLVARSTLMRLQVQSELLDLRDSISWTKIGVRAATSAPVRSALVGWALSRVGHNRAARLLGLASKVILFAKLTGAAIAIRRKLVEDEPAEALTKSELP